MDTYSNACSSGVQVSRVWAETSESDCCLQVKVTGRNGLHHGSWTLVSVQSLNRPPSLIPRNSLRSLPVAHAATKSAKVRQKTRRMLRGATLSASSSRSLPSHNTLFPLGDLFCLSEVEPLLLHRSLRSGTRRRFQSCSRGISLFGWQ